MYSSELKDLADFALSILCFVNLNPAQKKRLFRAVTDEINNALERTKIVEKKPSVEAQKLLAKQKWVGSMGTKDEHAVPLKVLFDMFVGQSFKSNEDFLEWWISWYSICSFITEAEEQRLKQAGLNSSMPKGVELIPENKWKRYEVVGIQIQF